MARHSLLFPAVVAAVISLALGPFQSVLWNGAEAPGWVKSVAYGVVAGALPPEGPVGAERLPAPPDAHFTLARKDVAFARADGWRRAWMSRGG